MANLYTSGLETPVDNLVELLIDQIDMSSAQISLSVDKYSAAEELIGAIVPPTSYVENGGFPEEGTKTRIRVYLSDGQVAAGEKVKIKVDSE